MKLFPIALAGLAGAALGLGPARAGTATANFNVTITVVKECSVTAPASINFGSVGAATLMAAPGAQSQTFTVLCSSGTPYTVAFTSANDLSGNATTHQMKGASPNTSVVQYTLSDQTSGATNTLPLGRSSSVITAVGTGVIQAKTLQASILAPSSAVAPDTYSDTVTMAVTY